MKDLYFSSEEMFLISESIQNSKVAKFHIPIVSSTQLQVGSMGLYYQCSSTTTCLQSYIIGKIQNTKQIDIYPVVSVHGSVALVADCPIEMILRGKDWEANHPNGHFHRFYLTDFLVKRIFTINGKHYEINGVVRREEDEIQEPSQKRRRLAISQD